MKTGLLLSIGALAIASTLVLTLRNESAPGPSEFLPKARATSNAGGGGSEARVNTATQSAEDADTPPSKEQIARVDAYLELERTRAAIQDYFDDPEGQAGKAQAISDTINCLESEGRVMGFEAMHLKLSWLALNTPDEETYEKEAAALVEDYAARDRAAREAFNPENIPGYTDYKTREAEIIAKVKQMDSFPQGQTRQQYLRERLLEARIEAYGEGGEQAPLR